jgi:16S rRNA (guanine(527)-N(7))-methyltransferase RsmG
MFHVKHSKKKPSKKRLNPEQVAAEVRIRLAPTLPAIGIVAKNHQFLGRIERLAATLALWGPKVNLTANPTDPDEIAFHIFDSLIPLSMLVSSQMLKLRPGFEPERRILDIGSGAGFPGLVIAAAINAQVTLVESRRKRATFLTEAAVEMGLRNVRVEQARAESIDFGPGYDLATARAVGSQSELFKIAARGLHLGGILMLYVSASQPLDNAAARSAGLVDSEVTGYDLRHGKQVSSRAFATWTRR